MYYLSFTVKPAQIPNICKNLPKDLCHWQREYVADWADGGCLTAQQFVNSCSALNVSLFWVGQTLFHLLIHPFLSENAKDQINILLAH